MSSKVSIIVPVYDVSEYLEACLNSVINQTFSNLEIIIVNDCSPDKRDELISLDFQNKDPRVKYIKNEKNLGLGGARNTGIKNSSGDYLLFVDSDDVIHPQMVEEMVKIASDGKCDIVASNYKVWRGEDLVWSKVSGNYKIFESSEGQGIKFHNGFSNTAIKLPNASWLNLYRRELFVDNQIFFPEHLKYEDLATTPRLLYFVKKIAISDDVFYYYRVREGSIVNSLPKIVDYFVVFNILRKFLIENNEFKRFSDRFYHSLIYGQIILMIDGIRKYSKTSLEFSKYHRYIVYQLFKHGYLFGVLRYISYDQFDTIFCAKYLTDSLKHKSFFSKLSYRFVMLLRKMRIL